MKAVVCAHKLNKREELLQRILSAAGSINNTACFISLQVLWSHQSENVSKQMEDTSKQLALVLNGESVTVHLTP
jgi:hypothetical protein